MIRVTERPLEAVVGFYAVTIGLMFIFDQEALAAPVYKMWWTLGAMTWGVVLIGIGLIHFGALWLNGANPNLSRPVRLVALFLHLCVSLQFAWYFYLGSAEWGSLTFGLLMPGLLSIIARRVMDALLGKGIRNGA